MRKFIEKLRALPEGRKKVIFFGVLVVVGLALGSIFLWSAAHTLSNFQMPQVALPELNLPANFTGNTDTVVPGQEAQPAQPSETADWKQYDNTALGFSLKYPKEWQAPQYDFGLRELTLSGKLAMNAYANQKELVGDVSFDQWINFPANGFDAASKQNIAIGKDAAIKAISVKKSYCNGVPLMVNTVIIGASEDQQNTQPVYVFLGPTFDCASKPEVIKKEYPEAEKTFYLILSTLTFNK